MSPYQTRVSTGAIGRLGSKPSRYAAYVHNPIDHDGSEPFHSDCSQLWQAADDFHSAPIASTVLLSLGLAQRTMEMPTCGPWPSTLGHEYASRTKKTIVNYLTSFDDMCADGVSNAAMTLLNEIHINSSPHLWDGRHWDRARYRQAQGSLRRRFTDAMLFIMMTLPERVEWIEACRGKRPTRPGLFLRNACYSGTKTVCRLLAHAKRQFEERFDAPSAFSLWTSLMIGRKLAFVPRLWDSQKDDVEARLMVMATDAISMLDEADGFNESLREPLLDAAGFGTLGREWSLILTEP